MVATFKETICRYPTLNEKLFFKNVPEDRGTEDIRKKTPPKPRTVRKKRPLNPELLEKIRHPDVIRTHGPSMSPYCNVWTVR